MCVSPYLIFIKSTVENWYKTNQNLHKCVKGYSESLKVSTNFLTFTNFKFYILKPLMSSNIPVKGEVNL